LLAASPRQLNANDSADTCRTTFSAFERQVFNSMNWRYRPRLCENVNRSRTSLSMQKTF